MLRVRRAAGAATIPPVEERQPSDEALTLRGVVAPFGRALLRTLLLFVVLGLVFAALSAQLALPKGGWGAALAATLSFIAWALMGAAVAPQRALAAGLVAACAQLKPGRALLGLVFDRLLSGAVSEAAARIPLAQAEERLVSAVDALIAEPFKGGGVRRRVRDALLRRIEAVTLARFRADAEAHGGVDLQKIRDSLSVGLDDLLKDGVGSFGDRAMYTMGAGAGVFSLAVGWLMGAR